MCSFLKSLKCDTQHVVYSNSCCFCLADIIDENLKTALQKDLNAMAPGLTIQVFKPGHNLSNREVTVTAGRIWLAQGCNKLVTK